jgi:hypothetical protein
MSTPQGALQGSGQLLADLGSMCGVWRDRLRAFAPDGVELIEDLHGGVPGAFPYENLVYVDLDADVAAGTGRYRQTNVVLSGREFHQRTFTATVAGGQLRFDGLGPDAPVHVGISGGPGRIWFVAGSSTAQGLARYAEPDLIRVEGDRRWRHTVLWRNGELARVLDVEGERLTTSTATVHELDPRGPGHPVHGERSVTTNYTARQTAGPSADASTMEVS